MEEFAKYIWNSIMPLYPNAAPEKGKWVILKCDSGPGRLNLDLLADLRTSGFILFPGVPNTTAVMQETDQNYGPFKTKYCKNLDAVVDARIRLGKPTTIPTWQVGLIVFGGVDQEMDVTIESAFEQGFSRVNCRRAWEKVGAAPLTRFCLSNKKVRRSLGDGSEDFQRLLLNIQDANDIDTHALKAGGYNGDTLNVTINEIPTTERITEEHSEERHASITKATTSGKLFSATNGGHLTSDNVFIGTEKGTREKDMKRLTIEKKRLQRLLKVEEKAKLVLSTKGVDGGVRWTVTDFDTILAWYNVPNRNKLANREEKQKAWDKIKGNMQPTPCKRWTDADECELLEASKEKISLGDTALGRMQRRKINDCKQAAKMMTEEEWNKTVAARESVTNSSLDDMTDGMSDEV